MLLYSDCINCLVGKQAKLVDGHQDEIKKSQFMKRVCQLVGQGGPEDSAPYLAYKLKNLREEFFGPDAGADMNEIKHSYNQLLLGMETSIHDKIMEAEDPVKAALLYSRIGNYIDFSAVEHVATDEFLEMLERENDEIEEKEYQNFCQDLAHASHMLYVLDNCGEIVLDKLVMIELMKKYPNLQITAMVRGGQAVNDATMEDAEEAGLTDLLPVITTCMPVQGIIFSKLGEKESAIFHQADVILAKGQGNYESMNGCGLNVYYTFLCKCHLFVKRFGVEPFAGLFINELR